MTDQTDSRNFEMDQAPTVIYRATQPGHAHLLKSLLEEYNIAARLSGESIHATDYVGQSSEVEVWVSSSDAEVARRIALSFERHILAAPSELVDISLLGEDKWDETDTEPSHWEEWPTCPACGTRRMTMCPICHTAGGDFPLADHQEGDFDEDAPSDLEIHLLCEICDEPFSPRFCRLCTNCEHDFGSGSEPQTANDHELTPRILIISIVLLAIAIGGMWYFSVVLGS